MSDQPVQGNDAPDDGLPPLATLVDMLTDAMALLDGVTDLIVDHRRACGDDHHELVRLQDATLRINESWVAAALARKVLRA